MSTADLDVGAEKSSIDDRPTCGLATASLVFGILSFVALPFIGGLVAVILGFGALRQIRESYDRLRGETRAKVGAALGFVNLIVVGTLLVVVWITSLYAWRVRTSVAAAEPAEIRMPVVSTAPLHGIRSTAPPSHGVRMANEMGRADYQLVENLQLSGAADPVVCMYDIGPDFYNPEIAVLTTKRISYVKDGRVTSLDLNGIESILDHRKSVEKYGNNAYAAKQFNIEIKGKDGTRMRIVVRPAADGPSFFEALNDAWKAAKGGEATTEAAPTPTP